MPRNQYVRLALSCVLANSPVIINIGHRISGKIASCAQPEVEYVLLRWAGCEDRLQLMVYEGEQK